MAEYKSPLSLSYTPPAGIKSFLGQDPLNSTLPVTPAGNIKSPIETAPEAPKVDSNTTPTVPVDISNSVKNPITGMYESGSTVGLGGKTEEPRMNIPTDETTSDAFGTSRTYQDLLAKRSEYEKKYEAALSEQVDVTQAEKQKVLEAKFSGDTTAYGEGAGYLQGLKSDIKTQTAVMKAQAAATMLGVQQKDIENFMASVPSNAQIQTSPTGDIIATSYNPTTGKNESKVLGNVYTGLSSEAKKDMENASQGNVPGGTVGGNIAQQTYSAVLSRGVNPAIASAGTAMPVTGDLFIDGSKIQDSQLRDLASRQSGTTGVPYIPADAVPSIKDADLAMGQMQQMFAMADKMLTPGMFGRIKGLTGNKLEAVLQTDPEWGKFAQVRLNAINYLKSMAQGGGFRTNDAEIQNAIASLVEMADNKETALTKINYAASNIDRKIREWIPYHKDTKLSQSSGSSSSVIPSGTVVKTKVGDIATDW